MLRDSLTVLHVVSKARSATKPSKSWTLAAVMGATSGRLRFDIRSQLTSPVVRQFLRSAEAATESE